MHVCSRTFKYWYAPWITVCTLRRYSPYRRFIADTSRRLTAKQLHRRLTVVPVFIRYTSIDSVCDFSRMTTFSDRACLRDHEDSMCRRMIHLEIHQLSEISWDNLIRTSFVRQQDTSWKEDLIVIAHTFPVWWTWLSPFLSLLSTEL